MGGDGKYYWAEVKKRIKWMNVYPLVFQLRRQGVLWSSGLEIYACLDEFKRDVYLVIKKKAPIPDEHFGIEKKASVPEENKSPSADGIEKKASAPEENKSPSPDNQESKSEKKRRPVGMRLYSGDLACVGETTRKLFTALLNSNGVNYTGINTADFSRVDEKVRVTLENKVYAITDRAMLEKSPDEWRDYYKT